MSRIGKQPVILPENTTIAVNQTAMEVKGPKGILLVPLLPGLQVSLEENLVQIQAKEETDRAYQGLIRTLLQNAVVGVTEGWQKQLELQGVGLRAALSEEGLNLSLGFSHPVQFKAPEGISFQVTKNVVTISGIDKQMVGEVAAQIRKLKKPEPYKGKGIRYSNEYVRRKAGKTGKTATK
jgi:large subunit ribosomal protein L6